MEEVVQAFNHVIDQGMAHYWCTSEWSAANIEEAHGIARRLNMIPPEQPQATYFIENALKSVFILVQESMAWVRRHGVLWRQGC